MAPSSTSNNDIPDANTNVEYTVLDGTSFKIPTAHTFFDEGYPFCPGARFLDEIRMLKLMQAIIAKENWHDKLKNPEIREKWLQEAIEQKIRKEVAEWSLKELEWCASVRNDITGVEPSGIEHVWKSDKLIDESLRGRFLNAVEDLRESLPKDYHPGSDGQVLNLIHPSLFCLVYGLSMDKDGKTIEQPPWLAQLVEKSNYYPPRPREHPMMYSHSYQWLPSEFLVGKEGNTKIASYINGLPTHVKGGLGMYTTLGDIFKQTVPLFEQVLSSLVVNHSLTRFPYPEGYSWWEEWDPPSTNGEEDEETAYPRWMADPRGYDVARREWFDTIPHIPLPIPKYGQPPMQVGEENMIRLGGHRLQAIVKIGSILLTPERPDFEGGNWHIEGMANERVVATAIYYFDSENIQGDRLRFRQAVDLDTMDFAQDDDAGAHIMYGIHREEAMVQDVGDIATPQGRVMVFPNIYQHSVAPFSLVDKTKPGHRSVLVFFLVDPTRRITSTAHVPPQDPSWYRPETVDMMMKEFPVELRDEVRKNLSHITRDMAEEHRLKLMEERTYATDQVTEEIFERPFNLCEH